MTEVWPPTEVAKYERRIEVDLANQMLFAMDGSEIVYQFPCSTGRNNNTPPGEWPIREKRRYNRALPEYGGTPIPYSLRLDIVIDGRRWRIAIHEYPSVPPYPASHGCIRLHPGNAEKLFEWAETGMMVIIE